MKLKLLFPCPHVQFVCLKSVTEKVKNGLGGCSRENVLICCFSVLHGAIITLLQLGSSNGLYDLVLLEHLKSACLPII